MRGAFPRETIAALKQAALRCFEAIETGTTRESVERYRFNPFSGSILLTSLLDFECSLGEITKPAATAASHPCLAGTIEDWTCRFEHCWVRKKYAPRHAPRVHRPNTWHQDGGLEVRFTPDAGECLPMTRLATCWIPLESCGDDSPGLEFVRRRIDRLLHYTELDDAQLRDSFPPDAFWRPVLEAGDGLFFLNETLHRTHVHQEMTRDRLSVEYRFFPK